MLPRLLFFAIIFASWNSFAEKCRLSKRSAGEVSTENFVVSTHGKEILFLSSFLSRPEQRAAVEALIDSASSYPEVLNGLANIFAKNKDDMTNLASTAMFISDALADSTYSYLYVNMPDEMFGQLEKDAQLLSLVEHDFVMKEGSAQLETLQKYFLGTVGVGAYLHAGMPGLFKGIDYANFASSAFRESHAEISGVEARYQDLMREFRRNPRTRKSLERAAHKLRSGGYKGWSNAEIKKDVLSHFWHSQSKKVESWLDLALGEKGQEREPPKKQPQTKPQPKQPSFVEMLMTKPGNGLVLVPQSKFKKLYALLKDFCD
jgi:hypothetical protein